MSMATYWMPASACGMAWCRSLLPRTRWPWQHKMEHGQWRWRSLHVWRRKCASWRTAAHSGHQNKEAQTSRVGAELAVPAAVGSSNCCAHAMLAATALRHCRRCTVSTPQLTSTCCPAYLITFTCCILSCVRSSVQACPCKRAMHPICAQGHTTQHHHDLQFQTSGNSVIC